MTCLETVMVYYMAESMANVNEQCEAGNGVLTYPQLSSVW